MQQIVSTSRRVCLCVKCFGVESDVKVFWPECVTMCFFLCLLFTSVKRLALPPKVEDGAGRSINIRYYYYYCFFVYVLFVCLAVVVPLKGGRGFVMSPPPVWNIKAVSLIPCFYISSFALLLSPVALSVILFCFCPFSGLLFP